MGSLRVALEVFGIARKTKSICLVVRIVIMTGRTSDFNHTTHIIGRARLRVGIGG